MATYRPDPLAHLTGELTSAPYPNGISAPDSGGKFTPDGAVLPFPGNTIICHIDRASTAFSALVALQDALKSSRFAQHFAFLPPESLHMTVFQGISGRNGTLPGAVAPGTPRDEVSRILLDRVSGLSLPKSFRVAPRGLFAGHSVTVEGATPEDEGRLREVRNALRAATGLNPPDFDTYTFHITLSYLTGWLTPEVARDLITYSDRLFDEFRVAVPDLELGALEFCEFENMYHFERLALI